MIDLSQFRICVTGGGGFLGQVVCRRLRERGVSDGNLIIPRSSQYDLTQQRECERMYKQTEPEVVIHLAADVGGIGANRTHPGRFFYANMAMGLHLIELARINNIRKFVQAGTVCAYPKFAAVPFVEDEMWNGYPEETNAPYGIAKKSLFVMLDAYEREYGLSSAVVVPVNLYGPGDNFDPRSSHVVPALIRKCIEACNRGDHSVTCWGSGTASREFLYVDDAAEGIVCAAERLDKPEPVNLGTGQEISIKALADMIADLCGFKGRIEWDASKPDGQPRRRLDITRARQLLGWQARTPFEQGLRQTIQWWQEVVLN